MKILKSRTFWTGVLMFLLGGVQAIEGSMDTEVFILVQGILALFVGYFRANPRAF